MSTVAISPPDESRPALAINRNTVLIVVACLALGYWLAAPSQPAGPLANRPVMRWIAKAAKNLLWVAVFVEPAPADTQQHMVKSPAIGDDGFAIIDHGKGW